MTVHCQTLKLATRDFPPVALSSYDDLPKDIMWVGMYAGLVEAEKVAMLFEAGLKHFPHLTGRLCKQTWQIVPAERDLEIELMKTKAKVDSRDLEALPVEELGSRYLPNEDKWHGQNYLLGVRILHLVNINKTIIGLRISHCVVDGAGLGLILKTGLLELMGKDPLLPIHDRAAFKNCRNKEVSSNVPSNIPQGYQTLEQNSESLRDEVNGTQESIMFTIAISEIKEKWQCKSLIESRVHLAAWLSSECKKAEPKLKELAAWCDVRGIRGFPQSFTGNCGCFVHYPLATDHQTMAGYWKQLTGRKGFKKIADIFAQLQVAEMTNQPLLWKNDDSILQINIVPHSLAHFDFGYGKAEFGLLLARNSPGIRISVTPDDRHFLIEAEVAKPIQEHLLNAAHSSGFEVTLWGEGKVSSFL